MENRQRILMSLASILVLGCGTQWLAWRIRVPAILLLLATGFLAGPVSGLVDPEAVFGELLLPIVSLSVGLILFEGGLNLRFQDLRYTWRSLLGLLTVGVVLTWAGATAAAVWLLGLDLSVALVIGALLTVTGPTVIGPLLRDIRPTGRCGVIAKWEGIIVDPIGATLALLVFEAIEAIQQAEFGSAVQSALGGLVVVTGVGLAIGLAAAALLIVSLQRFWIPDYLQNPVSLAFVIGAFVSADWLHHEAGLLSVTVMGVAMANQRRVDLRRLSEFKESLVVLLIAVLFILLVARVSLESLLSLGWRGLAFALVLILVIRPIAVLFATIGSRLTGAERCFLSWLAPRGIVAASVASVFALRLGDAGAAIAPATLVVVFITVAVYGLTTGKVARRLGLSSSDAQGLLIAGAGQTARAIALALQREGFATVLVDTRYPRIRKARDAGLNACFANILSEQVLDEVDFGGLGKFLALTSNDEVNTLAVARFREFFGRDQVYQLTRAEVRLSRLETEWQQKLVGRTLFGAELTFEFLDTELDRGAVIKTTKLTDTFDFAAFQKHNADGAWPLFLIDGKKLHVITADVKPTPRRGQAIISLVRRTHGRDPVAKAE